MPLERQKIGTSIGSGNFGIAGTPIISTAERKGPDLGRLLSSLNIGAQGVARKMTEGDVSAAQAAIREATLHTKMRPKGMSVEEHRDLQRNKINEVRDKFEDRGLFLDLFAGENKAVQTIDAFNGRAKAIQVNNTMAQIVQNTRGLPLEEREAQLMAVIQEGSAFTDSISEKSREAYMMNITEKGLQYSDQLLNDSNAQVKAESTQLITNTNELEVNDAMASLGGQALENVETDPAAFEAFHAMLDTPQQQEAAAAGITEHLGSTYEALSTINSRAEASQGTADSLIRSATKLGRADMIDTAKNVKLANGKTLYDLHGIQLENARDTIQDTHIKRQQAFRRQAAGQLDANNSKQYSEILLQTQTDVNNALTNLDDTEARSHAFESVNTQLEAFNKDVASGAYRGNEEHAVRTQKMLTTQRLMLDRTFGDASAEAVVIDHLKNQTLTQNVFNQYAHRLGPDTKKAAYTFIQPEIAEAKERNSQLIQAKQDIYKHAIEAPALAAITDGQAFESTSLNKATIAAMEASPSKRDMLPKLDTAQFKIDYSDAQSRLVQQHINAGKPLPTAEEMNEATKPVVDRYNKILQKREIILNSESGEAQRIHNKRLEEVNTKVSKEVPRFNDFIATGLFASNEFTPEETKGLYTAIEAGTLDHLAPEVVQKALGTAIVSDIRNSKQDVSSAIKVFSTQFEGFNPFNAAQRGTLANIIKQGMDESFLTDIVSTTQGGTGTTALRHPTDTSTGQIKNLIDRVVRTPFEATGIVNTFEDDLHESIKSGHFFTNKGLASMKRKYPDPNIWGDVEETMKSLLRDRPKRK